MQGKKKLYVKQNRGIFVKIIYFSPAQHDTEGLNCEKCKKFYYRPLGKRHEDVDACKGKMTSFIHPGLFNHSSVFCNFSFSKNGY